MGEPFLRFTSRLEGDLRVDADPSSLHPRRAAVAAGEWTWLRQVHGGRVVRVEAPGDHAGAEADAAVTAHPDAVLAVHTADCVPVLFSDVSGTVVGAAHAGWRGLLSGILEATVAAMADIGAAAVRATVGPHIRARCYEFGAEDLAAVESQLGGGVRAETTWGTPALDMTAAVDTVLGSLGEVVEVDVVPGCTACESDRFYSHRARGDVGRHAAVIRAVGA